MAKINTPKSDILEASLMNKSKNFLILNKLRLQKLSKENAMRKNDLSPRHSTSKSIQPLRSAGRENFANGTNIKKVPTSLALRFPAGADKKKRLLPKSAREINRFGKGNLKKNQNQIPSVEKKNQSVQSYNTANESFLKNAKVLEPSPHILAEIKENQKEASKSKFVSQKRVFENHEAKAEAHLDNLKEYLETGSISRRRKNFEQRREELERKLGRYGKITASYSDAPTVYKSRPLTKHGIKSSLSMNVNAAENYQNKTYLTTEVGDSRKRNEDRRKLVLMYQRKSFV